MLKTLRSKIKRRGGIIRYIQLERKFRAIGRDPYVKAARKANRV